MNLILENWNNDNISELKNYIKQFSKGENAINREKKIVNSSFECLAVPHTVVKDIINQISKGDFISFIENWNMDNLVMATILGNLICKIKDFDIFKSYFLKFVRQIDSWVLTDTLKINTKGYEKGFLSLSKQMIQSKYLFERRAGVIILFKFLQIDYIGRVIDLIKSMKNETEYYVNMAIAWLVCEIFIKQKEKAIELFESKCLNNFVINKAISKCRDSFRISQADKDMLTKYRVF